MATTDSVISLEYRGRVAVLTIANEKKLNALSQAQYFELAQKLRQVAKRDDVCVTVILARGKFFSAYVHVFCGFFFSSTICFWSF